MIESFDNLINIMGKIKIKNAEYIRPKIFDLTQFVRIIKDENILDDVYVATDKAITKIVSNPKYRSLFTMSPFYAELDGVYCAIKFVKTSDGRYNIVAEAIEANNRVSSVLNIEGMDTQEKDTRLKPTILTISPPSNNSEYPEWEWNHNTASKMILDSYLHGKDAEVNNENFNGCKYCEFEFKEKLAGLKAIKVAECNNFNFLMNYANPDQSPINMLPASRNISYALHLIQEREVLTERDTSLIVKNIENYMHFERRYYGFIIMLSLYAFILLHCNNIDPKDISSQDITLPKANISKKKKGKKNGYQNRKNAGSEDYAKGK